MKEGVQSFYAELKRGGAGGRSRKAAPLSPLPVPG